MGTEPPPAADRLLPTRRFLVTWTAVVVALTLAAWFLLPRWSWYNHSRTARVERGLVRGVRGGKSLDSLTIACPSGDIELEIERPAGIYAPQAVRPGDHVLVRFGPDGPSLGPKVRDRTLLVVLAVFFVILAIAGGPRALRTALSLAVAFVLLVVVLVPLAVRGWNPLAVALPLAIVIAGGTIFVVAGVNRKSVAATLGTLGGLVLATVVSSAAAWAINLTGLSVDFGPYMHLGTTYWQSPRVGHIDFGSLLAAGVVLSCLGAAMDVAISVATAVQEIVVNRPDIPRRELIRNGISVGRAAVWMTAATFFFVLLGAHIEPFLARSIQHSASEWVRLMGFEEISVEAVRIATAGLTMTLVAPLTALFASTLLTRRASDG